MLIYLKGSHDLIHRRMATRQEHFMPLALLDSQFAGLQEPTPDEHPITVDVGGRPSEIVGEIVDEYDTESAEAVALGDGSYRVSARMSIDDLGELFDLELDDDEVDTVGGLLAKALGRVPIVGSTVQVHGLSLRADRLEGRRNRVSHIIAAAVAKEQTDLEDLLDEAAPIQQGVSREQAE